MECARVATCEYVVDFTGGLIVVVVGGCRYLVLVGECFRAVVPVGYRCPGHEGAVGATRAGVPTTVEVPD